MMARTMKLIKASSFENNVFCALMHSNATAESGDNRDGVTKPLKAFKMATSGSCTNTSSTLMNALSFSFSVDFLSTAVVTTFLITILVVVIVFYLPMHFESVLSAFFVLCPTLTIITSLTLISRIRVALKENNKSMLPIPWFCVQSITSFVCCYCAFRWNSISVIVSCATGLLVNSYGLASYCYTITTPWKWVRFFISTFTVSLALVATCYHMSTQVLEYWFIFLAPLNPLLCLNASIRLRFKGAKSYGLKFPPTTLLISFISQFAWGVYGVLLGNEILSISSFLVAFLFFLVLSVDYWDTIKDVKNLFVRRHYRKVDV